MSAVEARHRVEGRAEQVAVRDVRRQLGGAGREEALVRQLHVLEDLDADKGGADQHGEDQK